MSSNDAKKAKYSYNSGKATIAYKSFNYIFSIASFGLTVTLAVLNSADLTKMYGNTGCATANEKGAQNCMANSNGNSVYCRTLADFLVTICTKDMNSWQDNQGAINRTKQSRNVAISVVAISGFQLLSFVILKILYYNYMFIDYHDKIEIFYVVFQKDKLFSFGIVVFGCVCLGLSQVELNILTNKDFKCNSNIEFIPNKCNDSNISSYYHTKVCNFFINTFDENCKKREKDGSSYYNRSKLSKDLTIVQVAVSGLSTLVSFLVQATSIIKDFNLHDSLQTPKAAELEDLEDTQ